MMREKTAIDVRCRERFAWSFVFRFSGVRFIAGARMGNVASSVTAYAST
jgi:hypothetical protein